MVNPLKYFRNRKIGLALGSGGAKGLTHISTIEYLTGMGINIDMIAGSSIGAVIGALYAVGSLQQFKDDILDFTKKEVFSLMDPVFPRSGLIDGNKVIEFLKKYIDEDTKIENLRIPLAILATDYYTGKSVVFRSGNILEALRGSISIPGIFVPVKYKSTFLIDGGVANPLPVNIVKSLGAGITIAVNLHPIVSKKLLKKLVRVKTQREEIVEDSRNIKLVDNHENLDGANKGKNWISVVEKWMGVEKDGSDQKMPSIFEVISKTIDIMELNNTMLMLKYNSPSVLIEPHLSDINTLDFSKSSRIISEGFRACSGKRKQINRNVKFWM